MSNPRVDRTGQILSNSSATSGVLKLKRGQDAPMPSYGGKRFPRTARRARKPMQEDWKKVPRGKWLTCTYGRCGYTWQYFGGHSWAECPSCHTIMKVAVAQRNYKSS